MFWKSPDPLQLPSLTPFNKKIRFSRVPLWFFAALKICTQIIDKYPKFLRNPHFAAYCVISPVPLPKLGVGLRSLVRLCFQCCTPLAEVTFPFFRKILAFCSYHYHLLQVHHWHVKCCCAGHGMQRHSTKMNQALWKTVLCENFVKTGGCKYVFQKLHKLLCLCGKLFVDNIRMAYIFINVLPVFRFVGLVIPHKICDTSF